MNKIGGNLADLASFKAQILFLLRESCRIQDLDSFYGKNPPRISPGFARFPVLDLTAKKSCTLFHEKEKVNKITLVTRPLLSNRARASMVMVRRPTSWSRPSFTSPRSSKNS